MQREPVSSDALHRVGCDPKRRWLEIEFTSGAVYRYFDVPKSLHIDLMQAESHGHFYAEHIGDAGFDYVRLA
jgi:hypothetical protein